MHLTVAATYESETPPKRNLQKKTNCNKFRITVILIGTIHKICCRKGKRNHNYAYYEGTSKYY